MSTHKPVIKFDRNLRHQNRVMYIKGLCHNHFPFAMDLLKYTDPEADNWDWIGLCSNPNAVHLLSDHLHSPKLKWEELSRNSGAFPLIEKCLADPDLRHNVPWHGVCENPSAVPFIERCLRDDEMKHNINWAALSGNPNAVHLLEQNPTKIVWFILSRNPSPRVSQLLETHYEQCKEKLYWEDLCRNPGAVPFLEQHMDFIIADHKLSRNLYTNENASRLIEQLIGHILTSRGYVDWVVLCDNPNACHLLERYHPNFTEFMRTSCLARAKLAMNPNAIHLLKPNLKQKPHNFEWWHFMKNPSPKAVPFLAHFIKQAEAYKINWFDLGSNPNLHQITQSMQFDFNAMFNQCRPFAKELSAYVLHPVRVMKLCDAYEMDMEEYLDAIGDC